MRKYPRFLLIACFIFSALSLYAIDIGVTLDNALSLDGYGSSQTTFEYSGTLLPELSASLSDTMEIFASAGLTYQAYRYSDSDEPQSDSFIPELLRTEFSWHLDWGSVKAGRTYYSDPLGFIANGLFDGARLSVNTELGTFSAGAWYTGLLYKEKANITMTQTELEASYKDLDYKEFWDTYTAPSRILAAIDWEHPSVMELVRAKVSFIAQFDASNEKEKLHSQYLAAKFTAPVKAFVADLGGALALIETDDEVKTALVGEVGVSWMPPSPFDSQLSLLGRFSSGESEGKGGIGAFLPLNTITQGDILQAKISGLSIISLGYTARLRDDLSASLSSSYFVRSDLGTYAGYPPPANYDEEKYALGNEFFARAVWSPVSDVQINVGGGIFLPQMGNVAPKDDAQWRLELNVGLLLY